MAETSATVGVAIVGLAIVGVCAECAEWSLQAKASDTWAEQTEDSSVWTEIEKVDCGG